MTATEPQTTEPTSKRPWYRGTWGWIALLLVLLAGLLKCVWLGWSFKDERNDWWLLAALAGGLLAILVRRYRPALVFPRWCSNAIMSVLFFVMGIDAAHMAFGIDSALVTFLIVAGVFFAIAVFEFFWVRQQFALQSLLLLPLGVAILCSVSRHVSILPFLIFLIGFFTVAAFPTVTPCSPSPNHAKDGPSNLKSQISNLKSRI